MELAPRANENVVPHRSLWLLTPGSFLKISAFFKLAASFSAGLFTQQHRRICREGGCTEFLSVTLCFSVALIILSTSFSSDGLRVKHESSSKLKPKHLVGPLVEACSIGYKSHPSVSFQVDHL